MYRNRASRPSYAVKRLVAALAVILLLQCRTASAEPWSFAVIADNRSAFESYGSVLEEIKSRRVNPSPEMPSFDFVLACGDIAPVERNDEIYRRVFPNGSPAYFPVRGNHEKRDDVAWIFNKLLPPLSDKIQMPGSSCVSYTADWKNIRLVVLDQYCDLMGLFRGRMAYEWLEKAIASSTADHVLVALHDPRLPAEPSADPLWKVLLKHREKVRAVFAGHYHSYSHLWFPDEARGVPYINAGNAGWISHSDGMQTIVEVRVDGKALFFRVVQTPDAKAQFKVREEFWIRETSNGPVQ